MDGGDAGGLDVWILVLALGVAMVHAALLGSLGLLAAVLHAWVLLTL